MKYMHLKNIQSKINNKHKCPIIPREIHKWHDLTWEKGLSPNICVTIYNVICKSHCMNGYVTLWNTDGTKKPLIIQKSMCM